MKKFLTTVALVFSAGLFATSATAGTISFADYAVDNEGGILNQSSITFSTGQTIRFVANRGPRDGFSPYFDDTNDGKPAGLGVCKVLAGAPRNADAGQGAPGAECLDSSDDSIDGSAGVREFLTLEFVDGPFDLVGLSFRDGNHDDLNNSDGLVRWSIVTTRNIFGGTNTFAEVVAMAAAGEFMDLKFLTLGYVDTEFYLESISDVPIPGAIPILLSGIAGLGFASRKKKVS